MSDKEQRPNSRHAPPWEREADAESAPFGSWLRQQRELREITLREIADATKISMRYLEALEDERFDLLPASLFARGFLRQYARYVGLDPDEAVNRLLVAQQAEEPEEEGPEERRGLAWAPASGAAGKLGMSSGNWKNVLLVVGVAGVLLALVFLIPWLLERRESRGRSEDAPPGVVPNDRAEERLETPREPEEEASGAPLMVTLDFREDCWVEATVDGEPRIGEVRVQGESLQLEAEEFVELRLGNAGVVDVEVNGEPFDLDAAPGEVRSFRIDAPAAPESRARPAERRRPPPTRTPTVTETDPEPEPGPASRPTESEPEPAPEPAAEPLPQPPPEPSPQPEAEPPPEPPPGA